MNATLEQRILRLEDLEEIRHLTARYADAINKGWKGKTVDLDTVAQVFAADAHWESHEGEVTVGIDAILAVLPAATSVVEFSMHAFVNPIILVDGDTATGHWLMWVASVIADDPRAVYMSADMTYIRTEHGWRIHTVKVDYGTKLSTADSADGAQQART
ncbi:nuclear transport factor 2 family protein [Nocardia sp. NPDC005998]|uniref:nuclear transport factor 2 family protein n=1 Tax=Nocardia sp. NPDC005998 TaxID=3156894 RepID=UPI0033B78C16